MLDLIAETLPANVHGTGLVIDGQGVLLMGPSGAGKSLLAMHCLMQAKALGVSAALVADDRVDLDSADGVLVMACPETLRGQLELRGAGIIQLNNQDAAAVSLIASAVDETNLERMPEQFPHQVTLSDHTIQAIDVPMHDRQHAFMLICQALKLLDSIIPVN